MDNRHQGKEDAKTALLAEPVSPRIARTVLRSVPHEKASSEGNQTEGHKVYDSEEATR
jgi:hypothetical protein